MQRIKRLFKRMFKVQRKTAWGGEVTTEYRVRFLGFTVFCRITDAR